MISIKKITTFTLVLLLLNSCNRFLDKTYNRPINTITSIKKNDSYGSLIFTVEEYFANNDEILASFFYKNKKSSLKFNFDSSNNQLVIISVGEESDYFLYAISELFEEELQCTRMKEQLILPMGRKGDDQTLDLFDKENEYVLLYKPHPDYKGSVSIRMTIDMT